ncbi:MAG: type III-B CRISPR module RAMP protein Cmr4, partial [Candidatus Hydrothermae bacterium]|nr:type III-B CRISPR module RAMP protein Cmr4 [Candidatus Hydrothermae bacterium]
MQAKLVILHALSPLHAGTGQGVGAIDLPIAREKGTGIPIVPGSSLKGVLRDVCAAGEKNNDTCTRIFGPETANASDHAGALVLTDLRLVALPVRSLAGVFAWVSSPFLLRRLRRDTRIAGQPDIPAVPAVPGDEKALTANTSEILADDTYLVLEDVELTAEKGLAGAWAEWLGVRLFEDAEWRQVFNSRFCIVHDHVMSYLLDIGTEVTARIRIDSEKKTVHSGALWYEEALPAESILAGLVMAQKNGKAESEEVFQVVSKLVESPLQVGGNATWGRGL